MFVTFLEEKTDVKKHQKAMCDEYGRIPFSHEASKIVSRIIKGLEIKDAYSTSIRLVLTPQSPSYRSFHIPLRNAKIMYDSKELMVIAVKMRGKLKHYHLRKTEFNIEDFLMVEDFFASREHLLKNTDSIEETVTLERSVALSNVSFRISFKEEPYKEKRRYFPISSFKIWIIEGEIYLQQLNYTAYTDFDEVAYRVR